MRRSSAAMSLGGLLSDTALDPAFGCSEEADWRTGPSSSSSSDHTTHQRGFPQHRDTDDLRTGPGQIPAGSKVAP